MHGIVSVKKKVLSQAVTFLATGAIKGLQRKVKTGEW